MPQARNEVRSIHWAVKLLLTALLGGLFAIGAFFVPANAFAVVIPQAGFGPICIAIGVLSTTLFATYLYRREGNVWRRSTLMGVVVGLGGAAIIVMIGFLFLIWFLSTIQLV